VKSAGRMSKLQELIILFDNLLIEKFIDETNTSKIESEILKLASHSPDKEIEKKIFDEIKTFDFSSDRVMHEMLFVKLTKMHPNSKIEYWNQKTANMQQHTLNYAEECLPEYRSKLN
jgi:hypothetical protein